MLDRYLIQDIFPMVAQALDVHILVEFFHEVSLVLQDVLSEMVFPVLA
jgi:hypothetical protein